MQHNVQEENEEEIEYLDDVDFVESDEDMEDAAYGSGSDASEGMLHHLLDTCRVWGYTRRGCV